jgi:hypothetical protein
LHEFVQLTVPHAADPLRHIAFSEPAPAVMLPQAPEPSQVTVPDPLPVLTVPHAPLPLLQVTPQPVEHVTLPHAEPPLHVALPLPVPNDRFPQLLLPRQVSAHVAAVQLILPHASVVPLPSHSTLHVPAEHVMSPHEFGALHVMLHDSELVQWMSPHAPPVVQPIVQCQPEGHVMVPLPSPVTLHVWVPKSHWLPGHTLGQTAASAGASV